MSGEAPPGLCGSCVHARVIETRRGSRFYHCRLSLHDPHYPRYPRLPVLRCAGYQLPAGGGAMPPAAREDPHE